MIWFVGGKVMGLGAVARKSDGEVLFAMSHQLVATWDVDVAEAKAIYYALKVAKREGYDRIEVESDSFNAINGIRNRTLNLSSVSLIINDIVRLESFFTSVRWNYVKRDGNVVAHLLAKLNPIELGERVWVGEAPESVSNAVSLDICDAFMNE